MTTFDRPKSLGTIRPWKADAAGALPMIESEAEGWQDCRFMTCSVLPVRFACNLRCPFCFSKSSISALERQPPAWTERQLHAFFEYSADRGATRLVITGGGEPLLRAELTVDLVRWGAAYFDEVACFTNGAYLTRQLAERLHAAGLSYVCYSRHHDDDQACRDLMGESAPALADFFRCTGDLKVRATCVMTRENIETKQDVRRYMNRLAEFGVREFTFKHTYVAYKRSVFRESAEDQWAAAHQVEYDPFADAGEVVAQLPWGPQIRRLGEFQVCYYYEPTPQWEKEHRLCRSTNLLSDGAVYASLEDQQSLLFRLGSS